MRWGPKSTRAGPNSPHHRDPRSAAVLFGAGAASIFGLAWGLQAFHPCLLTVARKMRASKGPVTCCWASNSLPDVAGRKLLGRSLLLLCGCWPARAGAGRGRAAVKGMMCWTAEPGPRSACCSEVSTGSSPQPCLPQDSPYSRRDYADNTQDKW